MHHAARQRRTKTGMVAFGLTGYTEHRCIALSLHWLHGHSLPGLPGPAQPQPAPDDPSKFLGRPSRPYGGRPRFEQPVRYTFPTTKPDEWGGKFTPLDETLGIITPSALHYVVQRGGTPDIDPR